MRRTPLRRMSQKRQDSRPARERVVAAALKRAGYRCEATEVVPEVECRGGLDVDEIVLRSGYRDGHLDEENTQVLCRAHHNWKHDNDDEAEKRGLRVWSWDRGESPRSQAQERQRTWLLEERTT